MSKYICPKCDQEMTRAERQESRNEGSRIHDQLVHSSCYWESLGGEIEAHPIGGTPASRPLLREKQ